MQYREDKEFILAIRLLAALAFAPPLHVETWYKQILVNCHIPDDVAKSQCFIILQKADIKAAVLLF